MHRMIPRWHQRFSATRRNRRGSSTYRWNMRCAISLACIVLCGCGNRHRSSGPIPQDAYIWQRIWSEPVLAAATNAKGKIRELVPLAAEVDFTGSGLRKVVPKLPLDKLANESPTHGSPGELGAHTLRKTFAPLIYSALDNDFVRTSYAMRHASVLTTVQYLSFWKEEVDAAILRI